MNLFQCSDVLFGPFLISLLTGCFFGMTLLTGLLVENLAFKLHQILIQHGLHTCTSFCYIEFLRISRFSAYQLSFYIWITHVCLYWDVFAYSSNTILTKTLQFLILSNLQGFDENVEQTDVGMNTVTLIVFYSPPKILCTLQVVMVTLP